MKKIKVVAAIVALSMSMALACGCNKSDDADKEDVKVVSLSPACTEMIYGIGGLDKVVGCTTYDDYPSDVADIEKVGDTSAPDVEAIAALEPTVVFATSYLSPETITALQELEINVMVIDEATDMAGVFANIQTVADAIDMSDEGKDLVGALSAEYEGLLTEEVPTVSVYYVVGYGEYGDYTAGAGTFIDSMITSAGAINAGAAADGWYISQEALIEADPDIILIASWAYDDFCAMEPYSSLSAVKNGNVIAVDGNLFERQGPRNLDGIELIIDAVADYSVVEDAAA